jgi:hypothetical protein
MIKGDYYAKHYNEFISTKATQEHQWNKLGEHITFYSSKKFFFVAGEGLSNTETSTVLREQVTHLGQTSTAGVTHLQEDIRIHSTFSIRRMQNHLPAR